MVNRIRLPRKLLVALGVFLLLLSSCAQSGGLTLEAGDDGRKVTLGEGETLTVSLPGNPSTGYT